MRILQEEEIKPAVSAQLPVEQALAISAETAEAAPEKRTRRKKQRKKHLLAKFLTLLALMLVIVAGSVTYLVMHVAGPLVKTVDGLPTDFPKDLALYQADQAKIKIQSSESKQRLLQLIKGLPGWSLDPFTGYLTTDVKTQMAAGLKDPNLLPANLSLADLESVLPLNEESDGKSVSLEWPGISQEKRLLADYYKKQFAANGYEVKQKIADSEIDLSFFKPGIEGAMSIADSFLKDKSSIVKMTVNYLNID